MRPNAGIAFSTQKNTRGPTRWVHKKSPGRQRVNKDAVFVILYRMVLTFLGPTRHFLHVLATSIASSFFKWFIHHQLPTCALRSSSVYFYRYCPLQKVSLIWPSVILSQHWFTQNMQILCSVVISFPFLVVFFTSRAFFAVHWSIPVQSTDGNCTFIVVISCFASF